MQTVAFFLLLLHEYLVQSGRPHWSKQKIVPKAFPVLRNERIKGEKYHKLRSTKVLKDIQLGCNAFLKSRALDPAHLAIGPV